MESIDKQKESGDTLNTDTYIKSLSEIEEKALNIAQEQLQSSFSIEKSIGFLEWKKSQSQTEVK